MNGILGSIFKNIFPWIRIKSGTIDGTSIGLATPSFGSFTVLKAATDPTDEHGVGDRGYNDARYEPIVYNDIGQPGGMDFGVGICPADMLALISGMSGMPGYTQPGHDNHGNYQYSDGSVLAWVPRAYYKIGTGTNGLAVNTIDVKGVIDFPDTVVAISDMTRANPCVVTATAHGRSNGDYVWISHITAQAEWKGLSGVVYKVANKADDTFELTDTSDANIDTSGYAAAYVPASDADAKIIYNGAMAAGYAWFRADIDGGKIQDGQFVDKYKASKNAKGAGYVASSIKNGLPISAHADHNPIADLTACDSNTYFEAIDAAHARDGVDGAVNASSIFFAASKFIYAKLAILSKAHGDASSSTSYCAWYNATYNYPKGCNNNALLDYDDATVLYTTDGFSNCGKTGSGTLFAKTTHNGQNCGIADLNGLMYKISLGMTCIASSDSIEAMTKANPVNVQITGHGRSTGDQVMLTDIEGGDWADLDDKIYAITRVDDDNFTLDGVDTSGFGTDYVAGTNHGTITSGTFYAAKPQTAMKNFTSGNSEATDHWGATGCAAMMEAVILPFETVYPNNGFGQRFGSGANQVLSEALFGDDWLLTGLGFPKDAGGIDTTGAHAFGKDYFYQYIRNELCVLAGGYWGDTSYAGVWNVYLILSRTSSASYVGCRCACYCDNE